MPQITVSTNDYSLNTTCFSNTDTVSISIDRQLLECFQSLMLSYG